MIFADLHIPEWPIMLIIITTLCATWFILGYMVGGRRETKRYKLVKEMITEILESMAKRSHNDNESSK